MSKTKQKENEINWQKKKTSGENEKIRKKLFHMEIKINKKNN